MKTDTGLVFLLSLIICLVLGACSSDISVPVTTDAQGLRYPDSKPYTRWWWFSGSISADDVSHQLDWIKEKGFGGVEIAWVYPLDAESNEKRMEFLGAEWADIVAYAKAYAEKIGIGCDFTFGTLWPFGGSFVEEGDAVKKFGERLCLQHQEKSWEYPVKGNVLNHMDRDALGRYAQKMLGGLNKAVAEGPAGWFCDSWEVDTRFMWTEGFDSSFIRRFGYDITPLMPSLYDRTNADVFYDYMTLVSEYVIGEFYAPFTEMAHCSGAFSRVQCGGAPADLLDAFTAVDVPETEAILYEPRFSRVPASAAVLSSKREVSAETFTCLYGWKGWPGPGPFAGKEQTADLKLLADALFAHGVNQIFWHGMPFNGEGEDNMFYATVHVGERSAFADELAPFNAYMQKVSSKMKEGRTYSDAAVYLPLEDSWMQGEYPEELQMPWVWGAYELRYISPAEEIWGYHPLWINRTFLAKGRLQEGRLICGDASFSFLYVDVDYLDSLSLDVLLRLAGKGFPICLKRDPREPGKNKSKDYAARLARLRSLPSVDADLARVTDSKPLIDAEKPLDYWAKITDEGCRLFISHPLARGLTYPLSYGQSFCAAPIAERVTVNWEGGSRVLTLDFAPYQSLLLTLRRDGCAVFEDIVFVPKEPLVNKSGKESDL